MTWDWASFLIGLSLGVTVGVFVVALMSATRDEHEKTGHDGPVSGAGRGWG